jgi:hypothetical protein
MQYQILIQSLVTAKNLISGHHPETASHACFLLDTDLFEFGPGGVERHKGAGRDGKFDWDRLGQKLNGTTYTSPDELWTAISKGNWSAKSFSALSHNCHDFVRFCLEAVGAGFFYKDYDQLFNSLY